MTASLVVERLDVVEELHLRFAEAGKPIRQLSLQRREEALHDGTDGRPAGTGRILIGPQPVFEVQGSLVQNEGYSEGIVVRSIPVSSL